MSKITLKDEGNSSQFYGYTPPPSPPPPLCSFKNEDIYFNFNQLCVKSKQTEILEVRIWEY